MVSTGPLRPNSTSDRRSYVYLPSYNSEDLHDGKVTINEDTGVRVCRTVSRSYLIQEQSPLGPYRVFMIVKDDDAGRRDLAAGRSGENRIGEVYECRIPVFPGTLPTCTCKAGQVKRSQCLHQESLSELVATGNLPDPRESGMDR